MNECVSINKFKVNEVAQILDFNRRIQADEVIGKKHFIEKAPLNWPEPAGPGLRLNLPISIITCARPREGAL